MTLDQLKTFYIVANAGSFTNAAGELNMDQSNVSRKIISMETRLRTKLFKRKARGLILTPEGQALLEETKIVLDRIEGMRNLVKNVHTEAKGLLSVNFLSHFYEQFILPHLTKFMQTYPDISLILGKNNTNVSDLEQAGMSVFIRPYIQNATNNVMQEFVTRLHIKLYASEVYVEKYGLPERAEDLKNHRLIAYEPSSELYPTFNWHLFMGGLHGHVHEPVARTSCSKTASHLIHEGQGIGPMIEESEDHKGLVRVLPNLEGRVLDFFYIYPTAHKNAIPVKKFGEFIHSLFRTE